MTQAESDKNAYDAYEQLCKVNGDMTSLMQLRIMVKSIGAEKSHVLAMMNSGLPDDVKDIMLAVSRHIESTNVTN